MFIMIGAFGIVMCYVASSVFFWNRPHLLHKRKIVRFKAEHISHRGGSGEGYENTLLTFRRAVREGGTDMLELDVRLTRDSKVVVFHDPSLKRLTGLNSLVSEVNYDELPRLKECIEIDTIPGHVYTDNTLTKEDRKIPLLKEIFEVEEFQSLPINIDIKDTDPRSKDLIKAVSDLIHEYNREQFTVWGSFNDSICKTLYETNPNVSLFCSLRKVIFLMLFTFTGLLPFVPIKETHYEVFLPTAMKRRRLRQAQRLPLSEKLIFWMCDKLLVCRPLVSHLRRRGIHVYMWVANSDDEFQECLSAGANGIMTDYPKKLRAYLDSLESRNSDVDEEEEIKVKK